MDDESFAKLVTVERLLMILLSDKKYAEMLEDARDDVHREFAQDLTKYFPSDSNYPVREAAIVENFRYVTDIIKINQDHGLLG